MLASTNINQSAPQNIYDPKILDESDYGIIGHKQCELFVTWFTP